MAPVRRVLHVLRDDHVSHVGGDLVQIDAAVAGLQARGVGAVASPVGAAAGDFDVVHLYNFWRPAQLRADLDAVRRRWPAARVAISPIWWPVPLRSTLLARDAALAMRAAKSSINDLRWWRFLRSVLRDVDLVLPNSDAEAVRLRARFRVEGGPRWVTVPLGVHVDRWPRRRAAPEERRALLARHGLEGADLLVATVARLEPRKNQLAVVSAIDRVDGAALLLVGPDGEQPYAGTVEEAVRARAGRVARTGALAPAAVAELLAAVDVHVLASHWETLGLATLEAAAVGCAVVVTPEGAATEYLGRHASLADPGDPASIAAAIRGAASSGAVPAEVVAGFDWSRAVDALAAAYERPARTDS